MDEEKFGTSFRDTLNLVPVDFMLEPEVDYWKKGDLVLSIQRKAESLNEPYLAWVMITPTGDRYKDRVGFNAIGKRRIPQEVRCRAAAWMLYSRLATVPPTHAGYVFEIHQGNPDFIFPIRSVSHYCPKFRTVEDAQRAREHFGDIILIDMLESGPNPIERWIAAERK